MKEEGEFPRWGPRGKGRRFRERLTKAIRNTIAVNILRMLREITSAQIFLSPAPISNFRFSELRERIEKLNRDESLTAVFDALSREVALDLNAAFLPQPSSTRHNDGMATKPCYSQSPARFSAALAAVEDKSHMNAEYGAAVLRDFLAAASLSRVRAPD